MNYSIAIYPDGAPAKASGYEGARRWERYMEEAAGAGFDEVFLSLHLPEFTVSEQLELLCDVAGKARALGQSLTVDVGGGQLEELLASENYCEQIRQAGVDFIRLDYGYTMEQVRGIWKRWAVKGFVLNASTYSEEELVSMQREFLAVDENIQLRACHNYYPRPESGLSYHFFLQQNEIFYRLGIPVYSCIPDDENPRGPVREGLPTVETHRRMGLEQVVRQLAASPANTGLMAADEYFAPEKLVRIRRAAEEERRLLERSLESSLESPQESSQERILELAFFPAEGATEEELGLVYAGTHHIRYDSNDQVLRSQSSRQMSEYAGQVAPRPACPRPAGTVTVDNSLYGRYSGEVEIVMEDLPADRRVNCVGQAAEEDLWKLAHYRYGAAYRFVPAGRIRPARGSDTADLVALWNRNLPYCPMDGREWAAVLLADENREDSLCLAAELDGRLIGCAIGMMRRYPYMERGLEEGKAWLLALIVDRDCRNHGLGGRLLSRLETAFRERGCRQIEVAAYSPYYFTPGVHESESGAREFLIRRGYQPGARAYWMERSLSGYCLPEKIRQKQENLTQEEFAFIPYQAERASELLDFLRDHFSTGWRVHAMRAMQNKRLEGHCFLCLHENRIVGYVQRGAGGDEDRFGPFGIAEEYRGRGLGSVLLHLMWQEMAKEGADRAYFRSTEDNGRRLYERNGMKVKETYYHFGKHMDV